MASLDDIVNAHAQYPSQAVIMHAPCTVLYGANKAGMPYSQLLSIFSPAMALAISFELFD